MRPSRIVAVGGTIALLGASSAALSLSAVAGASSAPTGPSQSAACAAPRAGRVTCLVHVLYRRGGAPSGGAAGTSAPAVTNTTPTGYSPATIATAYGFSTTGGAGTTIAVVDAYGDPTITANLQAFSSHYGLSGCTSTSGCFTKVNQSGGTTYPATTPVNGGWELETSLDVEWAHALAPAAHIMLVEASTTGTANMFTAVRYAAAHAGYVSMSWGANEFSGETSYDSSLAGAGVSFFAASGDTAASVIYPASSKNVVAVGGTTLSVTSTTGTWKSETAWSTAGGGCSAYETATAAQAAYPTYDQTTANCNGKRATPDLSLDANPQTGVPVYDSVPYYTTPFFGISSSGWFQVGGTSASTVMVAAHAAETAQQVGAPFVYGSSIRTYNVTSGSNGHPCEPGYNLCTGVGSWNTAVGTSRTPPVGTLAFSTPPQSLTAGTVSAAMSLSLSTPAPTGGLTVTLSSTSGAGGFSTSSGGPFAGGLHLEVAAGATASPSFYYEDTRSGSPTLTAAATNWSSGTQTETVNAATLTRIAVSPSSATVGTFGSKSFSATGYDAYSNTVTSGFDPTWTTTAPGTLSPTQGTKTTFTAGSMAGSGAVTATQGAIAGSASVTVSQLPALTVKVKTGTVRYKSGLYQVPVTISVSSAGVAVSGAAVTLYVYEGSTCSGTAATSASGTTGSTGNAHFTVYTALAATWCAKGTATKSGYTSGTGTKTFTT